MTGLRGTSGHKVISNVMKLDIVCSKDPAFSSAGEKFPLPTCFHSQDAEAAFVVVEGDALDHAGDFLRRGSALWDCGVHRGFIFAWAVGIA